LLELDGHLEIAVKPDICNVVIPDLARVEAQPFLGLAEEKVEGAADVLRREWLAVVPFDPLAQLERDALAVIAPAPAFSEIRHDGVEAVAGLVLIKQNEIVEHRHERIDRRDGSFLVDRPGRRVVAMVEFERSALLLSKRALACHQHGAEHRSRNDEALASHLFLPVAPSPK